MSWLPKDKVIVPVDFSEHSRVAVDTALTMVNDASHIYAIHVLPTFADFEVGLMWSSLNDEARIKAARQALQEWLPAPKYQGLHLHVVFGDPGGEIAAYAEGQHADLIVLPSHGRTGLSHLVLGSVAERVTRLAHCPVLVLRS